MEQNNEQSREHERERKLKDPNALQKQRDLTRDQSRVLYAAKNGKLSCKECQKFWSCFKE